MGMRSNKGAAKGKALQAFVVESVRWCAWLRLVQIPDPTVIQERSGGQVSGYTDAARTVDFLGWICKGPASGQVVALECKETSGKTSWRLDARFRAHQRDHLRDVHQALGFAMVLVRRLTVRPGDYLIPASFLSDDVKSYPWADLERFRVPPSRGWMDALLDGTRCKHWPRYQRDGWPGLLKVGV